MIATNVSCKKSKEEIEQEHLIAAIDKVDVAKKFKWIVVLPGLGCHGCIQEAEIFMKEHVKNKEVFFVLTKISSLKILQQKIGIKVAEQPNVYVDREDSFSIPTDNGIYPCIVKIEEGSLAKHEFQSPNNSAAFAKLNSLFVSH